MSQDRPTIINDAMNFGAVAGIYYIGKFCLFPLSMHSAIAGLFFLGLTLVVPFLIYQLAKRYRDEYCDGQLDFSRAFLFTMLTMSFASLLAAAAHYIYFAFIDGGTMMSMLMQSIEQLQSIDLNDLEGTNAEVVTQFNQYIEAMQQAAAQIQAMSAIDITMGMLSNNVSWSIILSLPIALIVKKNQNS